MHICLLALITPKAPLCSGVVPRRSRSHPRLSVFTDELYEFLIQQRLHTTPLTSTTLPRPAILVGEPHAPPKLALHLLHTPRCLEEVLPPTANAMASDAWEAAATAAPTAAPAPRLVHLWEDEWHERQQVVCSRLLAMVGRGRRVMARKTHVRRISSSTLESFLLHNHLWGPTQARFRYGLFVDRPRARTDKGPTTSYSSASGQGVTNSLTANPARPHKDEGEGEGEGAEAHEGAQLIAVASFSPRRHVNRGGERFRSHELIRYCTARGTTVVGGISKLIAAFRHELQPDDIVTVVDRNWGSGDGWGSLGFEPMQDMQPATFFIGPDGKRCHAMGTGRNPYRRQLPPQLLREFQDRAHDPASIPELVDFLAGRDYYSVNDAGARRLVLLLKKAVDGHHTWSESWPRYPGKYYLPASAERGDTE